MRFITVLLAGLLLLPPAVRADDPVPEPLRLAMAAAVDDGVDLREDWRFQATLTLEDGPVIGRFDGAAPDGAQWSLVWPRQGSLTETQSAAWDEAQAGPEDEEDSGGLFLASDALSLIGGDIREIEQTVSHITYGFAPFLGPDSMDVTFARHLVGEIRIRRDIPAVEHIRMYAPASFKPQIILRINAFEMQMDFAPLEGHAAPVLVRIVSNIEGSAAFQSISERSEMRFDEIEYLGADPGALTR